MNIWQIIFIQPLVNALLFFYHICFNNLGLAIIVLTIAIRLVLAPLIIPSMRSMQKMRDLNPELEKLKKRHKDDKTKLMQAQADLYKAHGVNPAAGCLPQIVQLVVLISLYQVFNTIITSGTEIEHVNRFAYGEFFNLVSPINTQFLSLDLAKPDSTHIQGLPFALPGMFLLISAAFQFLGSKMMMPFIEKEEQVAKKTPGTTDDFAVAMQQQSLYMFPLLTIVAGLTLPSGLVLYWTASSLAQTVQQYFISGWGGLTPWLKKIGLLS